MVSSGLPASDLLAKIAALPRPTLNYLDYMDYRVYGALYRFDFLPDEEAQTQHFCLIAPSVLAFWRLYQVMEGGVDRHIYKCLADYINPSVFAFLNQGIAQTYHVQEILDAIANNDVPAEDADGIVFAHLQTALIVSSLERASYATLYECEHRLEELRTALEQTSAAICSRPELFAPNFHCCGLRPLLKKSAKVIPFFLPVIDALFAT